MIYGYRDLSFATGFLFLIACGTENTNSVEERSDVQLGSPDTVVPEEVADSGSVERGHVPLDSPVRGEVTGTYVLEVLDASRIPETPPGFYKAQARLVDGGLIVYFYVPGGTRLAPGALVELQTRNGSYFLQELSEQEGSR